MILPFLPTAGLVAQVWTGALSTTWSATGNWSTGVVPGGTATATFSSNTANDPNLTAPATVGKLLFSSGADAEIFTGSALTLNGISSLGIDNQSGVTQTFNNTLIVGAAQTWNADSGDLAFAQVTLNNNLTLTGSTTFAFGGTLLLNGGSRTLTNNSTGTVTLSGGVTGNTRTLTVAGTGDTAITGAIATTTGGLIKTGTGTLVLSGANTYTGATTIGSAGGATGGTIRLGASNILANAATTIYAGTLDLDGNSETIGALTLGGGASGTSATVTTGAGTLTLGGNVTYTATNNPDGATISGNLALGGANRTFTIGDSTAAAADLTVSAVISGGNALTKSGTGTLVLSGANTYTGATSVNAGVLNIRHSQALGSTAAGTTVTTGEQLQLQGGISVGAEALSITGTGVGSTGALRNIADSNSYAGLITLTGNTQFTADAGSLTLSGGVTGANRNLTVTGAGDVAITGAITTGAGSLTKQGAGTLTLSGSNTNTGATNIDAGTLLLGASNVLSDSTALTIASGATFDVSGQTETIASIAGGGTVDLGVGILIAAGNASTTFSGTLAGTGSFTKQGSGILTLDNSFDFGGTFNLAGGTLRLSDISLSLGTLNITGNSIIDFAGVSTLDVANFSISGGVTLTIQNWADASDYFFARNWTGAASEVRGAAPMNQVTFTGFTADDTKWQSYDKQVTPVPEPSAYGALLLGLLAGVGAWRRSGRRPARPACVAPRP
ncbi:MAG: autotransporter-associated beta strand repeat-containing protein [Verrucomicrobiota bacterium]